MAKQTIVKQIPATKKKEITFYCDDCGNNSKGHYCKMCKKDLCEKCSLLWDGYEWGIERDIPYFSSDNPGLICQSCWDVGKEYRLKINGIRERASDEETNLIKEWENKAKLLSNFQLSLKKIANEQKDLPSEVAEVLNKDMWKLL
jgi:hypothetical protein